MKSDNGSLLACQPETESIQDISMNTVSEFMGMDLPSKPNHFHIFFFRH